MRFTIRNDDAEPLATHQHVLKPGEEVSYEFDELRSVYLQTTSGGALSPIRVPTKGTEPDHVEQFFSFEHLPATLREVSRPFCELARRVIESLPANPERTKSLDRLLEAKDAAVRALVAR